MSGAMRIARRADHKSMPWKNGRGLTEEVRAFPPDSGVDSFDWRLSIAHVGADGLFSIFPGIDRTIAVLEGAGIILDLPDEGRAELDVGGLPFAFPGDWSVASRNCAGATVDLNIMTRRGRCTHRMQRLRLAPGARFVAPGAGWGVFNTPAVIEAGNGRYYLERFDALGLEADESFAPSGDEMVEFLFAAISPVTAA
jgi:environmental stress-induced protein Ves